MVYQLDYAHFSSIFAVPTAVVDQHLKLCGALQLKALLLLLRHSSQAFTAEDLAAQLGVSPGDVRDALQYWIGAGVIRTEDTASAPVQKAVAMAPPAPSPTPVAVAPPKASLASDSGSPKAILVNDKPRLSREESSTLIDQDATLSQLIQEAQATLGKALNHADNDTIVSLYSYYGLPADFILMVLGYCKSIGKVNLRYAEKTAATWVDNGIDTLEKAEEHIHQLAMRNTNEEKVRSAFGLGSRSLIPNEKKYINTWFNQYGFDIDIVRLAYERMIENIGEVKFPYLHKILTTWHEKGIHTAREAVTEMETGHRPSKGKTGEKTPSSFDAQDFQNRILDDFMKQTGSNSQ